MPTVTTSEGRVHVSGFGAAALTPEDALALARTLVEAAASAEGDRMIEAHRRRD